MNKFGLQAELKTITQIHGKVFTADTSYGKVKIIPLYHPAVAVYGTNKEILKKDFKVLKEFIK
jgi:DNA polymerase